MGMEGLNKDSGKITDEEMKKLEDSGFKLSGEHDRSSFVGEELTEKEKELEDIEKAGFKLSEHHDRSSFL